MTNIVFRHPTNLVALGRNGHVEAGGIHIRDNGSHVSFGALNKKGVAVRGDIPVPMSDLGAVISRLQEIQASLQTCPYCNLPVAPSHLRIVDGDNVSRILKVPVGGDVCCICLHDALRTVGHGHQD